MTGDRLLSHLDGANSRAGVSLASEFCRRHLLKDSIDGASVLGIVLAWDNPLLDKAAQDVEAADGIALKDVKLLAPALYPGALYCAGANCCDHIAAMAEIVEVQPG